MMIEWLLASSLAFGFSGSKPKPSPVPTIVVTPVPAPTGSTCITCSNTPQPAPVQSACDDPKLKCLAVKVVSHSDSSGKPFASHETAQASLTGVNAVWKACGIGFTLAKYEQAATGRAPASAVDLGTEAGLDRQMFQEPGYLLVVVSKKWGGQYAGWTARPPGTYLGSVLDGRVAAYPPLWWHELGHYLSLAHVADASNVMNPTAYKTSTKITAAQCQQASAFASSYFQAMLR